MKASSLSFFAAVIAVLVGMSWGIVMAISQDHSAMPAHAHLNLLGWVSLFDPAALGELLSLPAGSEAVAVLCLGPVAEFYPAPMLALEGWRQPRPLNELLYENHWGERP